MVGRSTLAGLLCLAVSAFPAAGRDLRVATKAEAASMDSHANWDLTTISFTRNFYDVLTDYLPDTGLQPALALKWENVEPNRWRFWLRPNVRFHEGQAFTADDVVFSAQRALSDSSRAKGTLRNVIEIRKVDDLTVDFVTSTPNPYLPYPLNQWIVMSRAWGEQHDAARPANVGASETNYALLHANGTGPYKLESRQPGVQTIAIPNADWWGKRANAADRIVFSPVESDATRTAALLSGGLDLVAPLPLHDVARLTQTPGFHVLSGQEARAVFLGFDQARDELTDSDVRGRNPFRDLRVRQAVYQAIDNDGIDRVVMAGLARPAALIIPPGVVGFDASIQRLPFDPVRARQLLAEAGYPEGFGVTLDCSTDRDVGDGDTCKALVPMLARIGVKVTLAAENATRFLTKILSTKTSFYRMSWGANGWASANTLSDLASCKPEGARGYNVGGYCNAEVDALLGKIRAAPDEAQRNALASQAWHKVAADVAYVPLHYPPIILGAAETVNIAHVRGDGLLPWADVVLK